MAEGKWYYCLDHQTVEPYQGCRSGSRLGPYDTPAAAADALHLVGVRNEDWDTDPRFNDEPDPEADDEEREGFRIFGD